MYCLKTNNRLLSLFIPHSSHLSRPRGARARGRAGVPGPLRGISRADRRVWGVRRPSRGRPFPENVGTVPSRCARLGQSRVFLRLLPSHCVRLGQSRVFLRLLPSRCARLVQSRVFLRLLPSRFARLGQSRVFRWAAAVCPAGRSPSGAHPRYSMSRFVGHCTLSTSLMIATEWTVWTKCAHVLEDLEPISWRFTVT